MDLPLRVLDRRLADFVGCASLVGDTLAAENSADHALFLARPNPSDSRRESVTMDRMIMAGEDLLATQKSPRDRSRRSIFPFETSRLIERAVSPAALVRASRER